jgi:hypothetical protein
MSLFSFSGPSPSDSIFNIIDEYCLDRIKATLHCNDEHARKVLPFMSEQEDAIKRLVNFHLQSITESYEEISLALELKRLNIANISSADLSRPLSSLSESEKLQALVEIAKNRINALPETAIYTASQKEVVQARLSDVPPPAESSFDFSSLGLSRGSGAETIHSDKTTSSFSPMRKTLNEITENFNKAYLGYVEGFFEGKNISCTKKQKEAIRENDHYLMTLTSCACLRYKKLKGEASIEEENTIKDKIEKLQLTSIVTPISSLELQDNLSDSKVVDAFESTFFDAMDVISKMPAWKANMELLYHNIKA